VWVRSGSIGTAPTRLPPASHELASNPAKVPRSTEAPLGIPRVPSSGTFTPSPHCSTLHLNSFPAIRRERPEMRGANDRMDGKGRALVPTLSQTLGTRAALGSSLWLGHPLFLLKTLSHGSGL